ncbi:methyltransferase domain-containing protein [Paenibacillus bovis]|uniref:Small RNA 2'-O-methyltransferase n=1 Tax=Paenibacillus bovis TaxID=1616788 RepID=A0A172ZDZ3_9BACL|nr:methyltransferase domain-containing protein [Paenibacillus bovis]ANF95838.1 3' terminal RNA ribose 2'-O-methyltransferase Hen1 [Paenibacillus bovis]
MYLTVKAAGPHAGMISHLLAKNPHNRYERNEKGARVRLIYSAFAEDKIEFTIFATPDPIDLVKGSPDSYDITQYINDREFVVSSLFCSYIRPALGTALNGKPKADYADWVDYAFPLEVTFGPVASNLPDAVVESLFTALGYEVDIERGAAEYTFDLKSRSSVRNIRVTGQATLQQMLRQLFILMPVLDDYKHYYIGAEEIDKLHRYGEGWLQHHPQQELIIKRALRFAPLITDYRKLAGEKAAAVDMLGTGTNTDITAVQYPRHEQAISEINALQSNIADTAASAVDNQKQTEPPVRLNELRYQAIVEQVAGLLHRRSVVDFGAGEGKLSVRLAGIAGVEQVWAVEPSAYTGLRALERFGKLEQENSSVVPRLVTGSLFYRDDQWAGQDVIILCEVIEHINEHRLPQVMTTLLDEYHPETLIITTPNREYNAVYDMQEQEIRHTDHRFEWTRAELADHCREWVSGRPYEVSLHGIGEISDIHGQPTQMAIFRRKGESSQ